MTITLDNSLTHVSEKPWSDYKESDYSIEQWHRACLIHQHDGAPTSKSQCKLPVRTPDGALNRNGVHAAAAALAGARGGVQASTEEKASAGKSLVRLYKELGENAPASLLEHSALPDELGHYLEHHGVKGQKWGVRNDPGHEGQSVKTKKLPKLDKKWEKSVYSVSGAVAVHNAMADHFNARIGALNDKHPDANLDKSPNSDASKAYLDDVMKLQSQSLSHAVTTVHGTNPSGTRKAVFVEDDHGARIVIRKTNVQHAEDDLPDLELWLRLNASGHIVEANKAELDVQHGVDELVEDILEHHGVKGMKWGVTTKHPSGTLSKRAQKKAKKMQPTDVQVSQKKPGSRLSASGGKNQPAHEDAVKAASLKQKARASSTDSLSNAELQSLTKRMNLEQQYRNLSSSEAQAHASSGRKFVAKLLGNAAQQQAQQVTNHYAQELGNNLKK